MAKKPTIRDIAAEAGVSIALVSFVMNNRIDANGKRKYRVNEGTRERVMEIARKLDYQPNSAARILRSGRSSSIGVLLSDISNVFYGEIARQLENIAYQHGYTVLFGSTDENAHKLDLLAQTFIRKGVDGLLVVPCEGSDVCLTRLICTKIPLVILDRRDMQLEAPTIVLDNHAAMGSAVDLLLRRNLRKIDMISHSMRVSSMTEREQGYIDRMRAAGFADEDLCIHHLPFDNLDEEVRQLIPGILERKVEGLVFATNSLTLAAVKALSRMGVRVQKDIYVVGFDNSEVYELFNPQISHVQQPINEICRVSADMLFGLIEKEIPQEHREVVLSGEVCDIV